MNRNSSTNKQQSNQKLTKWSKQLLQPTLKDMVKLRSRLNIPNLHANNKKSFRIKRKRSSQKIPNANPLRPPKKHNYSFKESGVYQAYKKNKNVNPPKKSRFIGYGGICRAGAGGTNRLQNKIKKVLIHHNNQPQFDKKITNKKSKNFKLRKRGQSVYNNIQQAQKISKKSLFIIPPKRNSVIVINESPSTGDLNPEKNQLNQLLKGAQILQTSNTQGGKRRVSKPFSVLSMGEGNPAFILMPFQDSGGSNFQGGRQSSLDSQQPGNSHPKGKLSKKIITVKVPKNTPATFVHLKSKLGRVSSNVSGGCLRTPRDGYEESAWRGMGLKMEVSEPSFKNIIVSSMRRASFSIRAGGSEICIQQDGNHHYHKNRTGIEGKKGVQKSSKGKGLYEELQRIMENPITGIICQQIHMEQQC